MKIFLLLSLLMISVLSCRTSDDESTISNTDLVGTWNWISTEGGINAQINDTPQSTGKIIHLELTNDFKYSITENGNQTSNGTYVLSMEKSIYSGNNERFIVLSNNQEVVMKGIINVNNTNKLVIADNNHDGVTSTYSLVE